MKVLKAIMAISGTLFLFTAFVFAVAMAFVFLIALFVAPLPSIMLLAVALVMYRVLNIKKTLK